MNRDKRSEITICEEDYRALMEAIVGLDTGDDQENKERQEVLLNAMKELSGK